MEVVTRPHVLDSGSDAKQYCKHSGTAENDGIKIVFDVYQLRKQLEVQAGAGLDNALSETDKVLMIMGFAAGADAWLPTIKDLFMRGDKVAGDIEIVVYDNRGIGRSGCPADKAAYTSVIMAKDALAIMDALGWRKVHVVGHSMGGMIAERVALAAPDRVASLTLISVSGGGSEAIPMSCTAICAGLRGAFSKNNPRSRAKADLAFHFSPKLLKQTDAETGRRVGDLLTEEYVRNTEVTGPQSAAGQRGHLNAVLTHPLKKAELKKLAEGGFPIEVIQGRYDILALPRHAARLARQLGAPLVMVDGAHFITRDCAKEINDELLATIEAVRRGATHAEAVRPCHGPAMYERACCCF